jgi:hypothetical protein
MVKAMRAVVSAAVLATFWFPTHAQAASEATITGTFGDSCRDFAAHSSKDISFVELHYADGRAVKDETMTSPDLAIDGGPGDEISSAIVKSGTSMQSFTCRGEQPPSAVIEIRVDPHCAPYDDASAGYRYWFCLSGLPNTERTVFIAPGDLEVWFTCDLTGGGEACRTFSVRGTSSTDPDNDITSWSIDFCGDTVVSGDWVANPPAEVTHLNSDACTVTLTVTDSAGQTDTDTVRVGLIDGTPD